jgi:hypothetical protein
MRGFAPAFFGVIAFVVAGFIRGGLRSSPDPELIYAASSGLAACELVGVLAGGVAMGIHLARDGRAA